MMIIINFTKERDSMRITWDKLAQFVAFLVMVAVFRLLYYQYQFDTGAMQFLPTLPPEIGNNKWTLGLVFWEDMFFGFPIYLAFKYLKQKWLAILITVVLSVFFGLGHEYQGMYAVALTALAPYFVSNYFGSKYGFGTAMCGHVLYDVSTVYLIQLLPYLL